jgi:pantothenate synthetase
LSRALVAGQSAVADGITSAAELSVVMRGVVATEPLVDLDYAVAVDATTLVDTPEMVDPASVRLLIAAQVGPVRLIDNAPALAHKVAARRALRQLERTG